MNQYILKFLDEAEAIQELPSYRTKGPDGDVWDTSNLIPVGTVFEPTGNFIQDAEGNSIPEYVEATGWFVVLVLRGSLIERLKPFFVPSQPGVPLFSGVNLVTSVDEPVVEPAPQPPVVEVPTYPIVDAITFKLLFTSEERIAARNSVDPVIMDFWDILNDTRTQNVNMNLTSTQNALLYLESVGILTTARREKILTGKLD